MKPAAVRSDWVCLTCCHSNCPYAWGKERRFPEKSHIIGILFIVFDIETVFLIPWAVIYRDLGVFGFVEGLFFVVTLGVGLLYAWKKGALEWE